MATPPKPPKDTKPAARRAPRKAPATSTARRAAAAPPKQADPAKAEAAKPATQKTAPPTAAAPKTAAPARRKAASTASKAPTTPTTPAATPRAKAPPRAKPVAATSIVPKIALPDTADVTAAAKVVTETVSRNRWTIGAIVAAAGAGLAAFLTRGRIATALGQSEGHVPTDLLATGGPGLAKEGEERAIPAFRPDMGAPMTAAEREALRPATGAAPSLTSDRGAMNTQTGPAA